MPTTQPVRAAVIGCGDMGRHHIGNMLQQLDTTRILDFGHFHVIVDFSLSWTPSRHYMLWFLLRNYYM